MGTDVRELVELSGARGVLVILRMHSIRRTARNNY